MALIETLKKLAYKPHSTLCILISEYDITYVKAMSNHLKLCNFVTAKTVQNLIKVCKQKTEMKCCVHLQGWCHFFLIKNVMWTMIKTL